MPWHDLTAVQTVELALLWVSSIVAALRAAVVVRQTHRRWTARRAAWLRAQPSRDALHEGTRP